MIYRYTSSPFWRNTLTPRYIAVLFHPISCVEKWGCGGGKHGTYAQTRLRPNTAEHRESKTHKRRRIFGTQMTMLYSWRITRKLEQSHQRTPWFLSYWNWERFGEKGTEWQQSARQQGDLAPCALQPRETRGRGLNAAIMHNRDSNRGTDSRERERALRERRRSWELKMLRMLRAGIKNKGKNCYVSQ